MGISNCEGFDVNSYECDFGNTMMKKEVLFCKKTNEVLNEVLNTNSDCIIFSGVLEHMCNLREVLAAIHANKSIKYMFFLVPMFSFSNYVEMVFPEVYSRVTGGGSHSHLFSDSSLQFMYNKYNFEPIGEWRFATDIMDLFRAFVVTLEKKGNSGALIDDLYNQFPIDEMQLIIDKLHFQSEIHVVVKVRH